ncbi:uncharacterized protein LOC144438295 [Glandiceps talaboti]
MTRLRHVALLLVCVWFHRFVSGGDLIEYVTPGEQCNGFIIEIGDQYHVSAQLQDGHYMASVDCIISFRSHNPDDKMFVRILRMDIDFTSRCTADGLYIYDGTTMDSNLLNANDYGICGDSLSLPNYYKTTSNEVGIRFVSDDQSNDGIGFELVVTPYYEVETEEECVNGFKCLSDTKCMSKDVECNGKTQCADGSDEPSYCSQGVGRNILSPLLFTVVVVSSILHIVL